MERIVFLLGPACPFRAGVGVGHLTTPCTDRDLLASFLWELNVCDLRIEDDLQPHIDQLDLKSSMRDAQKA